MNTLHSSLESGRKKGRNLFLDSRPSKALTRDSFRAHGNVHSCPESKRTQDTVLKGINFAKPESWFIRNPYVLTRQI